MKTGKFLLMQLWIISFFLLTNQAYAAKSAEMSVKPHELQQVVLREPINSPKFHAQDSLQSIVVAPASALSSFSSELNNVNFKTVLPTAAWFLLSGLLGFLRFRKAKLIA